MPHTYAPIAVHVIFSTKNRVKAISKTLQPELWAYMAGVCQNHKIVPIQIGGFDDHSHALIQLPATVALAKAVEEIKSNSSLWLRREKRIVCGWQQGYGAFSVWEKATRGRLGFGLARYRYKGRQRAKGERREKASQEASASV
jgi:putative transposase